MITKQVMGIATWVACVVAIGCVTASDVLAQTYPDKAIRWIVPYPPGGGGDIAGRILGQKLSENIGRPVVVDNRAGAAGIIGTEVAARAAPDGYTLIFATNVTHAIVVSLYPTLSYDPIKDFAPITNLVAVTNVLVVHPAVPASSVGEVVAFAKLKPGGLNYASAGSGSNGHLAMELFKSMAGIDVVHTPYKGNGPAMTDLLAGRVQIMISNIPPVEAHIKSGKLRAVATTGKVRSASMPNVPTVAETGIPGYESDAWWGVLAPAGTPKPVVDKLNAEFLKVLRTPDVKLRLAAMGLETVGSSPEELAATIKADIVKWARVVKQSGAKVE